MQKLFHGRKSACLVKLEDWELEASTKQILFHWPTSVGEWLIIQSRYRRKNYIWKLGLGWHIEYTLHSLLLACTLNGIFKIIHQLLNKPVTLCIASILKQTSNTSRISPENLKHNNFILNKSKSKWGLPFEDLWFPCLNTYFHPVWDATEIASWARESHCFYETTKLNNNKVARVQHLLL